MTNLVRPDGWVSAQLGEVGEEVRGSVRPEPSLKYEIYSVPAFPSGEPEILDGSDIGSSKRPVEPCDILLCKINPRINRVWIVGQGKEGVRQIASTEWLVLRLREPGGSTSHKYVMWYLRSPEFRKWIELNVEGATGSHTRAKSPSILRQEVPLAPADEQARIVATIEEQLSRLDSAETSLRAAHAKVKRCWVATLAMLESITNESIHLSDLASEMRYGTSIKCSYEGKGLPVLRIPNVQHGRVNIDDLKQANDTEVDLRPFLVEPGDLLFVRTNGSRDLIGRVGAVGLKKKLAFASYLIRVRPDLGRIDPEFAALIMSAPRCRQEIESKAATTAGQYNLNLKSIGSLSIPLPPISDQREIVARLGRQRSMLDSMEETIVRAQSRSDNLRRSILREAFSGRLVSQDPSEAAAPGPGGHAETESAIPSRQSRRQPA